MCSDFSAQDMFINEVLNILLLNEQVKLNFTTYVLKFKLIIVKARELTAPVNVGGNVLCCVVVVSIYTGFI